MTFEEAMEALEAGYRIRRPRWNDESYMARDGASIFIYRGGRKTTCELTEYEMDETDWLVMLHET